MTRCRIVTTRTVSRDIAIRTRSCSGVAVATAAGAVSPLSVLYWFRIPVAAMTIATTCLFAAWIWYAIC